MEPIRIGMLGLGTVGAGAVNVLRRNAGEIARRAGRGIEVTRAAMRDPGRPRSCDLAGIDLTGDPGAVVDDPGIDVVVDLIGGTDVAREAVLRAIRQGKHVVTANKALVALHGNEVFAAARSAGAIIMLTHRVREPRMNTAVARIEGSSCIEGPVTRIRVEHFDAD